MSASHQEMVYSIALFVISLKIILCYYYFVQEINMSQMMLALKNKDLKKGFKKTKRKSRGTSEANSIRRLR